MTVALFLLGAFAFLLALPPTVAAWSDPRVGLRWVALHVLSAILGGIGSALIAASSVIA